MPRCNLACTPCYHSREANRVRVDGAHTRRAVAEQMELLRTVRGPRAPAMLARLRSEQGARSFLAHNMTVTAASVDQIAAVARRNQNAGFAMFSFQPAAFVGDERRCGRPTGASPATRSGRRSNGAGARLPFRALQHGDERCNRTTYGCYVGSRYHPLPDDRDPADLAVRDVYQRHLAGITFGLGSPLALTAKLLRVAVRHPSVLVQFARWSARAVRRVGIPSLLRHGVRPVTFVMHSFMDASVVTPSWEALQRGQECTEPALVEAQQRLRAC